MRPDAGGASSGVAIRLCNFRRPIVPASSGAFMERLLNEMKTTGTFVEPSSQGIGRVLRPKAKVLPEDARAHNRSLVLRQLFHIGPASRADLARATGLTRVTVSDLINDLLGEGLVADLGTRPGNRVGKPATLVGLCEDAFHILAIDISDAQTVRGVVLDLTGKIEQRQDADFRGRVGDEAVEVVVALAQELIARSQSPILGVGVGVIGIVTPNGTVVETPELRWKQVPLAQTLVTELGLDVFVDNDASLAALAEHTFADAEATGMMLLRAGLGVGAGILLDGALLLGHGFAAGEIGHVTVGDDPQSGETCSCGRRGCLETVFRVSALQRRVDDLGPNESAEVLAEEGRRLGVALAPVVGALNLREIRISGPSDLFGGPLIARAVETIRERTIPVGNQEFEMRMATLEEDIVLLGACARVLCSKLGVA